MTAPAEEALIPLVTPHVAQHPSVPVRQSTHFRAIAFVAAMFLVVVVLAFPRHPSAPGPDDGTAGSRLEPTERVADLAGSSPRQAALPAAPIAAPVAASVAVAPRAATIASTKKALAPKPEKNHVAESTKSGAPIAAVTPVAVIPLKDDAATKLPGFETIPPPASASASIAVGAIAPVTITGCLEVSVNQDEFRLTDTEGADAPKSRSWRTGFLKKRSSPVALVEPPERLALQTHVGRRVSATGLLISHDLKVSALRVVGPSCN